MICYGHFGGHFGATLCNKSCVFEELMFHDLLEGVLDRFVEENLGSTLSGNGFQGPLRGKKR